MEKYTTDGASSRDALLQAMPQTSASASAAENAPNTKTGFKPLQWWQQWRQGQQEQQQDQALEQQLARQLDEVDKRLFSPFASDRTDAAIGRAGDTLTSATYLASIAAMYAAYNTKHRGSPGDIAYAEATAAVALAAGMATYTAAPDNPDGGMYWPTCSARDADCAIMSAEAAYAAAHASRTWSQSIAQMWPWGRAPLPTSAIHVDVVEVVDRVIAATTRCAAAARTAIEAAQTWTMTSTIPRGRQVAHSPKDVSRLLQAGKMAHASATSARAAASAVRATHPALAMRADRAAFIAVTASAKATIMRLKVQAAFASSINLLPRCADEEAIHEWLATFESLRSETAPLDLGACMADLNKAVPKVRLAAYANDSTSHVVALMIREGIMKVATAGSGKKPIPF